MVCHSGTPHLIAIVVSYDCLSPKYRAFALSLAAESIPKSHMDAMVVPHWKTAMNEEYATLIHWNMWELVPRPHGANVVSCK